MENITPDPRKVAEAAVKILDSKRARDIRMLRVTDKTELADYFVIATGNSTTQIKTLSGEIEEKFKEDGVPCRNIEGFSGGTWVLMDYSTVVIHIFSKEAREYYSLDRFWAEAEKVDIAPLLTTEDGE